MTEQKFIVPDGYVQTESAVDGISVYMPGKAAPGTSPQRYVCPSCGASTRYDVAAGGVACEHCGHTAAIRAVQTGRQAEEFEFTLDTLSAAAHGWGVERREIHCDACGAEMTLDEKAITSTCPFCASNQVSLRQAASDKLQPRYIIPFQLKAADLSQRAAAWLGRGWFHPDGLARSVNMEHFSGVYLPFWTFDARMRCAWKAEVGRTHTVRNADGSTRVETRWHWRSGRVDVAVDDLVVNGSSHISSRILDRIQPFDLGGLTEYSPDFLAGWSAHAYDVSLPDAWEKGKVRMREQARKACHDDIAEAQVRNFSMRADFAEETWRYVLLPVYLASYRYKEKIYQVMANGQTGEVAGQKPVEWLKIWLAIAALLLPGLIIGLVGLPLLVTGIGVLPVTMGAILLVIGVVLAVILYRKAVESEAA